MTKHDELLLRTLRAKRALETLSEKKTRFSRASVTIDAAVPGSWRCLAFLQGEKETRRSGYHKRRVSSVAVDSFVPGKMWLDLDGRSITPHQEAIVKTRKNFTCLAALQNDGSWREVYGRKEPVDVVEVVLSF